MNQLITTQPTTLQFVPVNGFLALMFDPEAILANADAPDMVAEVLCALTESQGRHIEFTGEDLAYMIRCRNTPPGQKMLVEVHP
ncbi:hypothetical protein [Arenimonas sp. MALMAid1274]|uniref:hypothetical protein n=1 Tax=Arenimonas sp. MALMAid1274 TaxID=3411630 RepID=UPI003BA373DE